MSATIQPLDRRARRQLGLITAVALALFLFFRWLPTGTNLSHMDFRAADAKNSIEFCDPLNPQFIPVVEMQSPVALTLTPVGEAPLVPGQPAHFTLTLKTASGKPIAPEDLIVTHTKLLHLLIIDPWLNDYQHVHPEPGAHAGEWTFAFTPRREGKYRVFADFTPVVTARGLYASTDVQIGKSSLPASFTLVMKHEESWVVERDGYQFALVPGARPVRSKVSVDLKLAITRTDGKPVPMDPVMGAFAHLVAFDEARSGFAHLHPNEFNLSQQPDAVKPVLNFKIMIPAAGNYVIWAQLNLGGREVFVPFWFEVE
ncbi:MAG: hypothetical protein DUW69_000188 [Verrucomicrobia bacterium]|nr:MAG: hypothetical protein DUW69_000188 [Verrucomicrobiota bacterium]